MEKTHYKKLFNPDYLGAYALDPESDAILTIDYVQMEEVVGADGKKETLPVVHFKERDYKPMVLNITNAKSIEKLYGSPYIQDWSGKRIQLYVTQVKAFGETVDAVRIRSKKPTLTGEELTPDSPKWPKAIASLRDGSTSIAKIQEKYKLTAANAKRLEEEAVTCQEQAI